MGSSITSSAENIFKKMVTKQCDAQEFNLQTLLCANYEVLT